MVSDKPVAGLQQTPERGIVEAIEAFFGAEDLIERQKLAKQIENHAEFRADRLSEYLHRAKLYKNLNPGIHPYILSLRDGRERRLTIRIPEGYTPERAWPVLYALHPSGGSGPGFVHEAARLLGERVEQFVIVAPTNFRQTSLDAPGPENDENPQIWLEIRKLVHVDPDRVYLYGFSLGGFAAWTYASLHAEQFAGTLPAGATLPPIELPRTLEMQLRSLEHVRILTGWGEHDSLPILGLGGFHAKAVSKGNANEFNPKLVKRASALGLDLRWEIGEEAGHSTFALTPANLDWLFASKRPAYPAHVYRAFRYLYQAKAYWVEGTKWKGDQWVEVVPSVTRGGNESQDEANDRVVSGLLGEIEADARQNRVTVRTSHLEKIAIWLSSELVDFAKPITVTWNGRQVFRGRVSPNLLMALTQAAASRDFGTLRWARLDFSGDSASAIRTRR